MSDTPESTPTDDGQDEPKEPVTVSQIGEDGKRQEVEVTPEEGDQREATPQPIGQPEGTQIDPEDGKRKPVEELSSSPEAPQDEEQPPTAVDGDGEPTETPEGDGGGEQPVETPASAGGAPSPAPLAPAPDLSDGQAGNDAGTEGATPTV